MAQHRTRKDGWTPERQLAFLAALTATRNVTAAARAAGISRKSAYRLRSRPPGALFAHLWDKALAAPPFAAGKGHNRPLTDGRIARSLGNHFRRESGEFGAIGVATPNRRTSDRTCPS
ncbi:hypothetical protein [Sphingomonas sp.]|uniref:hypothetical protein n=1 Tax=Sphingomonas sp. TaxID=28214 RepID=UPI0025FAE350|nr:hypothetical protein [Sphingomonas sp.]MBV9528284.1 hypothetical protein [Sphingomonas sp.]